MLRTISHGTQQGKAQRSPRVDAGGLPGGSGVKNGLPMQETQEMQVQSLGREDPLKEGTATHSSFLAWRTPWTEDLGGLQSMGLQKVRHD